MFKQNTNYKKLDQMFIERWSPREFSSTEISNEEIETIFEAARWSPSCYNEQPWRFSYAHLPEDLKKFRATLVEANQAWANQAPLLIYLFSKKHFTQNNKENRWANFDAGAAWMALTLQANKLGLHTHAIGGFDADKVFSVTKMDPDKYEVICAIAVGKVDNTQNIKTESTRKTIDEIVFEGSLEQNQSRKN